jgi:hypothetical protein
MLRFCDKATLDSVRAVWKQYDESVAVKHTKTYRNDFRVNMKKSDEFKDMMHGTAFIAYAAGRSAAPLSLSMAETVRKTLVDMWNQETSGVSRLLDQYPNPLYATALSDSVTLAYPSNPLLGFHLATAGVSLTDLSPLRLDTVEVAEGSSKLLRAAKVQFTEWTKAFRKLSPDFVVRYVAADSLALCQTLQHSLRSGKTSAHLYRRQLDMRPLVLCQEGYGTGGDAPRQFDVVDASNVSEHLDVLNLLVSASPLLKDSPSSTIFTALTARKNQAGMAEFDTLLCGHTRTLSLLLGLAPVEFWTNATAVSYLEQLSVAARGDANRTATLGEKPSSQYGIAWKLDRHISGARPPPLSIDAEKLASILLKVYNNMFGMEKDTDAASSACPPYHRGSFVALVEAVCSRVHTSAAEVGRLLGEIIHGDSALSNAYSDELALSMSLSGIYSEPGLTQPTRRDTHGETFRGWKDVPEAVAITLVVPSSRWKPLLKEEARKGITLVIEACLRAPDSESWIRYADVQVTFGEVTEVGSRENEGYTVGVQEDPKGSLGESPMIASFYASVTSLASQGTSPVNICLEANTQTHMPSLSKLGLPSVMFEAHLDDSDHVYITRHALGQKGLPIIGSSSRLASTRTHQTADTTLSPEVDEVTGGIIAVSARVNITSNEGSRLLQEKVPIRIHQTSSFSMEIIFGERRLVHTVTLPVPVVHGESTKTRIARKSSYVEVVVKLAEPNVSKILDDYVYPTVITHGSTPGAMVPVTLNIPHLNLDTLPIIDISDKTSIAFLGVLASSTFSSRERRLREELQASNAMTATSARFNLKESIFTMLMVCSGLQGGQTGLVALAHPKTGVNMLMFVSALRLDAANGSVALDAAVIPMTREMLRDKDFEGFLLLLRTLECCDIIVDDAELLLWKKILPALAERCRTWSHKADCEYVVNSSIPVSVEPGEQILCSCGQGRLPEGFVGVPDWEEAARKYATRIAISPTFAVPYVANVIDGDFAEEGSLQVPQDRCRHCGATDAKSGGALRRCTRCLEVKYCSAECQKRDWKKHRMECQEAEMYHRS